jgi:hypothetical protein
MKHSLEAVTLIADAFYASFIHEDKEREAIVCQNGIKHCHICCSSKQPPNLPPIPCAKPECLTQPTSGFPQGLIVSICRPYKLDVWNFKALQSR